MPSKLQAAVDEAQAAFAQVTQAQARVQSARADAEANRIRQRGYRDCPACARIDELKAIPPNVQTFAPGGLLGHPGRVAGHVRLLEVVVVLVFLAGSVAIVRAGMRAAAGREIDPGPWEPVHRFEDGVRRVYVGRGVELEPVGVVVPSDPEYDEVFLALMDRARDRAAVLNSERSG